MISVKIDTAKAGFFDREVVKKACNRAAYKHIKYTAGYIRRVARNSMKPAARNHYSEPGTPPNAHAGVIVHMTKRGLKRYRFQKGVSGPNAGLRNILYYMSSNRVSAIIGPTRFGSAQRITIPELHEYGGVVTRGGKRYYYPARPYMAPAMKIGLEKTKPKLKDMVKR